MTRTLISLTAVLMASGCSFFGWGEEEQPMVTPDDLRAFAIGNTQATTELIYTHLGVRELGQGWYGVDRDGDGDVDRAFNDRGEVPPNGEPGIDILDEVLEDRNNDGKWDHWRLDSGDPNNQIWETEKRDTNRNGKLDQIWRAVEDDTNANGRPDAKEWSRMAEEEVPVLQHPNAL